MLSCFPSTLRRVAPPAKHLNIFPHAEAPSTQRHDVIRRQILEGAAAMAPWLLQDHGMAEARPVVVVPLLMPITSPSPLLAPLSPMGRATAPLSYQG